MEGYLVLGEPGRALFRRRAESEKGHKGSTVDDAETLVSLRREAQRIDIESPRRIRHKGSDRLTAPASQAELAGREGRKDAQRHPEDGVTDRGRNAKVTLQVRRSK